MRSQNWKRSRLGWGCANNCSAAEIEDDDEDEDEDEIVKGMEETFSARVVTQAYI